MRRRKFGSALAAVAIATAAAIPILAAPAGAVTGCGAPGGIFPATPGAQSGVKFDCTTNAGANVNSITIADANNTQWHHGAARTVAVTPTPSTNTITYASGAIVAGDIGRPISGGCIGGAAFIRTAAATSATLSVNNGATCAATTATIEYTRSRVLTDASCSTAASSNLTSATATFAAADLRKSVSGGPFGAGAKITAVVNATTATVTPAPTAACTAPDTITIGAATYNASNAVIWAADPNTKQLTNSAAPPAGSGQAFSCSGTTLTATAGAVAAGGGFSAAYAKLKVVVIGTTTVTTTATTGTANTLTLAAACPAGITAAAGTAVIGEPGANAPRNGSAMTSLSAELNLAPTLVATQDDCNKNTFEGFQVIGAWNNPGGYGPGLAPPVTVSTGQISFPTSVIAFAAFVRPQPTGDALLAGAHYEFVFPLLPTTLAVCTTGTPPAPANPTAISFGINPTVLATAPFLPTGSGNPADPAVRAIGPQTGAFAGKYSLSNSGTVIATGLLPSCTIQAATVTPSFACGDA
ncbi:MAG: hypothetical protein QOI08_4211 [Actinomycetota bacterium]|jgi:hypothetical protein|nr:hypothetical protein [Actinomycetota bacterium]